MQILQRDTETTGHIQHPPVASRIQQSGLCRISSIPVYVARQIPSPQRQGLADVPYLHQPITLGHIGAVSGNLDLATRSRRINPLLHVVIRHAIRPDPTIIGHNADGIRSRLGEPRVGQHHMVEQLHPGRYGWGYGCRNGEGDFLPRSNIKIARHQCLPDNRQAHRLRRQDTHVPRHKNQAGVQYICHHRRIGDRPQVTANHDRIRDPFSSARRQRVHRLVNQERRPGIPHGHIL